MSVAEHDRRRSEGYYLTSKQFWTGLLFVLALMGLTPIAIVRFTLDAAVAEHIKVHNESRLAHPDTLLTLKDQRAQMMETIARVESKLDGIEKMLSSIAANGGFNTANGKKK